MEYVRSMLDDKGGLSTAEREVIESLEVQDLLERTSTSSKMKN